MFAIEACVGRAEVMHYCICCKYAVCLFIVGQILA